MENEDQTPPVPAITIAQTQAIESSKAMQALIKEATVNEKMDVGKLRELLAMDREIRREMSEYEARQSFARVCAAMPKITKHGRIEYGAGKGSIPFAKWEDVQDAIKSIYEPEGFSLRFTSAPLPNGWIETKAILTHYTGVEFRASMPLPLDTGGGKNNVQGAGSSGSYGDRYSTKKLFNLRFEGEDDDGKTAGLVFIGDKDAEEITRLIKETGTDSDKFLSEYFSVSTVENLQAANAIVALNLLHTKKRAQEKKKAGGAV